MPRPHLLQNIIPIQIQIQRSSSILRRLSMTIHVRTVHIRRLPPVHDQPEAFLKEEEYPASGAAFHGMFRAFGFTAGVENGAAYETEGGLFSVGAEEGEFGVEVG